MSSDHRKRRIDAAAEAVRGHQSGVVAVDEAAAEALGISLRELNCLDILESHQKLTPSQLADKLGITTGAMTGLIDRLAGAGYVERVRDHEDRRRVYVTLTDEARRRSGEIYGPMAVAAESLYESFTDDELEAIRRFMTEGRSLLVEHAHLIREAVVEAPLDE